MLLLRILDFGSYMPPDAINKADQGQCYISNWQNNFYPAEF